MAYQKKYYYQFTDRISRVHVVELWQNTAIVLTAEEIKGSQNPFIVEMPELSHKFQVVRGTGAAIGLFSDTDMKFYAGLEHIDPKEFLVKHYVDTVLNWIGYLNSEMYSEPYDINFNYLISTTANDGFALMDRFRFVLPDGSKYTGIYSKFYLLQICLAIIDLPYTDIRIKLATTFDTFTGVASSTILHESFVNCANFYDEDDLPMTLREVIEAILAPYGAFIIQSGGSIYITDIHTLAGGGSIAFQKFDTSTGAYIADVSVNVDKTVSGVGYLGTGHGIERSGGTNRQVVVYSPYPTKDIISESIVKSTEFSTVPGSFSTKNNYSYRTLSGNDIWSASSPADFEESYKNDIDESAVYLRMPMITNNIKQLGVITPANYFIVSEGAGIQTVYDLNGKRKRYYDGIGVMITADLLAKTFLDPYGTGTPSEILAGAQKVIKHELNYVLKCGDYYYDASLRRWGGSAVLNNYVTTTNNGEYISNKWVSIGENGAGIFAPIKMPAGEILFGNLEFEIWSNTAIQLQGKPVAVSSGILMETWVKNIAIKLVNLDGSEITDSDIETVGLLNEKYANPGETITLKTGTQSKFSDKGQILVPYGDGYMGIAAWTRAGQEYRLEELLLNSLCSNYQANYVTLSNMNLKNSFSLMSLFTDSAFIGSKKLMIKGGNFNFAEHVASVSLVEISQDSLTIVKN